MPAYTENYAEKLHAFYAERIKDLVTELKTLCKRAEDARDRDDVTSYDARVAEIEERRPVLQEWYRKRRELVASVVAAEDAA